MRATAIFLITIGLASAAQAQDVIQDLSQNEVSGTNCSFRSDPEKFRGVPARTHRVVGERVMLMDRALNRAAAANDSAPRPGDPVEPLSHPRRNFIDDEIFSRLAAVKVKAAPLSTDEEFLRRVTLDLTGRIPAPADIRAFVGDADPSKRTALINKLINSPEFNDKWTMWLGDLLQNNVSSVNVNRNTNARNALHKYISQSVAESKSIRDMFYEVVGATGNSFDPGPAAFMLNGTAPGGPKEDRFDMMLYKSASTFLGLGHYDCLLCHNGRGHLESLSLWGSRATRTESERMAAFFSKTNFTSYQFPAGTTTAEQQANFYNGSQFVDDVRAGTYALPTTYGNRPNRPMLAGNVRAVEPAYRDGTPAKTIFWRNEFAENMIRDPLLYINFVNRLWKQMFNVGLVDAVDQLDPDRLDPDNPPPAPWTLQATHPALLVKLANAFRQSNADMREVLRLIAESSAYQLSSRYNGAWTPDMVPLFARHYPRRMDGEEIHDAIVASTGVFTNYTVTGWTNTVKWAMQLPDSQEPRSNGTANNFMNNFLRGNRDVIPRSQASTIVQSAALMNDGFINSKFHMSQSPVLQAIAKLTTPAAQLDEIFLTFLSRLPTEYERANALPFLTKATTTAQKNAALEDLAWVMLNKLDFGFSY